MNEKNILVECCPDSLTAVHLSSSSTAHSLPALLSRGVAVSLGNDGPAGDGLTYGFFQMLNGAENTGLSGLATMAQNSLRWSCFVDQGIQQWDRDIKEGMEGDSFKASRLRDWHDKFERFCHWVMTEFGTDEERQGEEEQEAQQE